MSRRSRHIQVAAIVVLLAASAAGAQGVAFAIADGQHPQARLARLDLETGELTVVGEIGYPGSHVAFDSAETLYGIDAANDQLLVIDRRSGEGTPSGSLTIDVLEVMGLTFDNADRLWMAARDNETGPSLYEIDPSSGQASRIAGIAEEHLGSLASWDGTVFMAGAALAVVHTTGGLVIPVDGSDFGIWVSRATDFDSHGTLRGLMLCGPCMAPFDVLTMSEIDTTTGMLVDAGPAEPHGTWALAILRDGLFFDGFESGNALAWTGAVQ